MTLAQLIPILLQGSIFGMVLSIGLRVGREDAMAVLTRPRALVVGGLAMFVIMPLVAAGLVAAVRPDFPVGLVLLATALSPVPPILPNKEMKAGASAQAAVGLMVAAGVLAVILIPFGARLIAGWFGVDVAVPVGPSARIVAMTVLVPVVAGLMVRGVAPDLAARIAGPVGKAAAVLLLVAVLPVLVQTAPAQWQLLGGGTLLIFVIFAVVGTAVGHWLGGPDDDNRTVLALSTASRHPGVAAAVAVAAARTAGVGSGTDHILPAALLYLIVSIVVTGVYLAWRRKQAEPAAAG